MCATSLRRKRQSAPRELSPLPPPLSSLPPPQTVFPSPSFTPRRPSLGVLLGPLGCDAQRLPLALLPHVGDLVVERVEGVGAGQQQLDGKAHSVQQQRGGPLVFERVKADAAKAVDVGVVDLGQKVDLGRDQRVLRGQEDFETEDAAFEASLFGAGDDCVKVAGVVLRGGGGQF